MNDETTDPAEPNFDEIRAKLLKKSIKTNNDIMPAIKNTTLFKNFNFGNLNIKNHLCFINLNDDMFYENGIPNSDYFEFYNKISNANLGLIITGGVYYHKIKFDKNIASLIDIKSLKTLYKHKKMVNQIHLTGSKIFLQIKPIFGRGDNIHNVVGIFPISASYNNSYHNSKLPAIRISDSKCNEIVDSVLELTKFSKEANYDGIMINGDSFNILGEMCSKEFNRRIFGYFSNTNDLIIKILNKIKQVYNRDIRIVFSFTVDTFLDKIYKNNAKSINSLQKLNIKSNFNDIFYFIKNLVINGVDGFIFRFGTFENEYFSVYNQFQDDDLYYSYYSMIRNYFDKINLKNKYGEKVSIIYTDNLTHLNIVNNYIKGGIIDFVDITRQIYADTNFVQNLMNDIKSMPCIKCGDCNQYARNCKTKCSINPLLVNKFNDTTKMNKIAVIGAGLAGIVCSNYLTDKNILVDLFEINKILNKTGRICEIYNFDKYLKAYNDYIENSLNEKISSSKVNLFLNTKFKTSDAKNYDAIIIATGFKEKFLNLNGSVLKNVKSIYDVLSDKDILNEVERIAIYAKTELSIKLAIYLASEGKKVTIIFPEFNNIKKIYNDRFSYYFYELTNLKVKIFIDAQVKKINQDFVDIIINNNCLKQESFSLSMNLYSKVKYKKQLKLVSVDMDLFIYEPELIPNNKLFYDIVSAGYTGKVFMIGNALQISSLSEIVDSAFFVAKNL